LKDLPLIHGFNKSSEAGDNVFAVSIFLGSCNLRCPYCMNHSLVNGECTKVIDLNEIKNYVLDNKVSQVNISGGEPTCTKIEKLINLIEEIKSWGCKVGLSTNGTNTNYIKDIINHLSYITMDIKAFNDDIYESISVDKGGHNLFNVLMTYNILRDNWISRTDFAYEIRITLFPPFINKFNINDMSLIFKKNDKIVLQQFRNNMPLLDDKCSEIKPYSEEEVQDILNVAKKYSSYVSLRYV